jgi:hypothetical protein
MLLALHYPVSARGAEGTPELLLAPGSGPLGGTEGNPSSHGFLLYRSRGTPKLPGDLTGRGP